MPTKVLFVHGFGSKGVKAKFLEEAGFEVLCPTMEVQDPSKWIQPLKLFLYFDIGVQIIILLLTFSSGQDSPCNGEFCPVENLAPERFPSRLSTHQVTN